MKVTKEDALTFIKNAEENIDKLRKSVNDAIIGGKEIDISGILITCDENTGRTVSGILGSTTELAGNLLSAFGRQRKGRELLVFTGMKALEYDPDEHTREIEEPVDADSESESK